MKIAAILLLCAALAGCTSSTQFGECIGMADDKDPTLVYKLSKWNLFIGIVTLQFIIPPIVIAVEQTYCPVGRRP